MNQVSEANTIFYTHFNVFSYTKANQNYPAAEVHK